MAKYGLLVDAQWCSGCHSCEIACQMEHGLPVGQTGIKVVKIGPWVIGDEADETDDIKCAPLGTNCYNVAWDLYELIETSLPILRAHDEGDCNPDMMSHLYEGLN